MIILDDLRAFEVWGGKHPGGQDIFERLAGEHRVHVGLVEFRADHESHAPATGDEVCHSLGRE